jgi:hypothetical protein
LDFFLQSTEDLQAIRKAQKAAVSEGWFESLAALAFRVEDMTSEGITLTLADRKAAVVKLQEEFARQKQAILDKGQCPDFTLAVKPVNSNPFRNEDSLGNEANL